MRILGLKTARTVSRWLKDRIFGGALILGYHSIRQPADDAHGICVAPSHFSEHLEVLHRHAYPISLSQLVQHLLQGTLPPRAVAVTFDDGYVDNLANAQPLLEQHGIPAAFFVCTAYLGQEFWWDELARLIFAAPAQAGSLSIAVQGEIFEWRSQLTASDLNGSENRFNRKKLLEALYPRLLPLDVAERRAVLDQVALWAGCPSPGHAAPRALTEAGLLDLSRGRLTEIGAHTLSHPVLSGLPISQQVVEIQSGKTFLEEMLGKPVAGFAYPNGSFTAHTQALVQQAGFVFACGSQQELARSSRQLYALPRFWPKDWDGEQFTRKLTAWIDGFV